MLSLLLLLAPIGGIDNTWGVHQEGESYRAHITFGQFSHDLIVKAIAGSEVGFILPEEPIERNLRARSRLVISISDRKFVDTVMPDANLALDALNGCIQRLQKR